MSKQIPASALTANDATQKGATGQIYIKEDKSYRYFKVKDLALAAGNVVEYSTTSGAVTKDRSGGTSVGRTSAGVAVGTVTSGNYGWVQTSGRASVTVPAGVAIAAGALVTTHATSDGGVITATTATFRNAFAVALGADTATTSAAGTVDVALIRV